MGVLASLTVALEISQGLAPHIGELKAGPIRRAYVSTALFYSIASYVTFTAVTLPFAGPIARVIIGRGVDVWAVRAGLLGIGIAGVLYLVQDQLRWQLRPRAYAAVSLVNALVTTTAVGVGVLALHAAVVGVMVAQLIGTTCALALALALSRGVYRRHFDWPRCREMLAFSIPLVPSSIGVFLNGFADRLALQHERSLTEVGVYGVGYRLAVIVGLLLIGFQGATTPLIVARRSDPETPAYVARIFRLFCAAMCIAYVGISVLAEPLLRLLAAPEYSGAATVVPFLVLATFLAGMYVFAPGPVITRRTRLFALINVFAGLLNAGLAFALVPSLGIRGAGIATLLSSFVSFVLTMMLSQWQYPVPHHWGRLLLAFAAATSIAGVTRALTDTGPARALAAGPMAIRLIAIVLVGAIVSFLLVTRSELRGVVALLRLRPSAAEADAIAAAESPIVTAPPPLP